MNKNNVVKKQDEKISARSHKDNHGVKVEKARGKSVVPSLAAVVTLILFIVSLWVLFKKSKYSTDAIIVQDIQVLQQIFERINQDCKIIDFNHSKNYIDFLTVKEFVGSEVGSMNLAYPKNWKGPYLKHNPTVLEHQYIVLKNKKNYYLAPGDGVVLANGQAIGNDIILNENSDIDALLQDSQGLKSSQGALILKIETDGSYLKKELQAPLNGVMLKN